MQSGTGHLRGLGGITCSSCTRGGIVADCCIALLLLLVSAELASVSVFRVSTHWRTSFTGLILLVRNIVESCPARGRRKEKDSFAGPVEDVLYMKIIRTIITITEDSMTSNAVHFTRARRSFSGVWSTSGAARELLSAAVECTGLPHFTALVGRVGRLYV